MSLHVLIHYGADKDPKSFVFSTLKLALEHAKVITAVRGDWIHAPMEDLWWTRDNKEWMSLQHCELDKPQSE